MAVQSKLLRALQEREIEPVGSNKVIPIDVRFIAATSRNLEQLVSEGLFRADLYYRLNVLPLQLPPLRERLDDLPQLVSAITAQLSQQLGCPNLLVTDSLLQALAGYHWPGNIRELRNVLERALLFSDHGQVSETLLANFLPGVTVTEAPTQAAPPQASPSPPLTLKQQVAVTERRAILAAIDHCQGNKRRASKVLGISRAALYEKLKRLGL
jgi:DNA-binding NtrC family response regulator